MKKENRTLTQNGSMHLWFTQVSKALNDAGYSVQAILKLFKEGYDLEFTTENVKEILWRPAQKGMYGKLSTKDLDKHKEITEIHKVVMRFLSEKAHIDYIPFPFECDECHGLSVHHEGCSVWSK